MFSFKGFFTQDKNTHLEHLEDDIINNGSKGGENAINFIKSVRDMLAGSSSGAVNMTVKWDGAPAIICGTNPENGKFFVGTKSVFNVTPKINYSLADIKRNHTGGAAAKLSYAFKYLKTLPIKGILQGDLLFTDDKKSENINGERMITFTPNTITYAVPANSGIGRQVARAKMGIVFHTSYTGTKMSSLTAGFGTVKGNGGSNIFLASAQYTDKSGSVMFNKSELTAFDAQIRMAQGSLSKAKPVLDEMSKTSMSDSLSIGYKLKTFFNHFIKTTQGDMGGVRDMQKRFETYYENVMDKEIDSRKTEKGKAPYIKAKKDGLTFLKRNKTALYFAIASHITLANCKNTLLRKMNQIQSIGHFLRTPSGYKVTAPEGYVAVDQIAGAVKLVDRLEFSRQNFTMPKGWS